MGFEGFELDVAGIGSGPCTMFCEHSTDPVAVGNFLVTAGNSDFL